MHVPCQRCERCPNGTPIEKTACRLRWQEKPARAKIPVGRRVGRVLALAVRVHRSERFPAGRSKDWTANFDLGADQPKNLTKIIEGQYVNKGRGGASMSPKPYAYRRTLDRSRAIGHRCAVAGQPGFRQTRRAAGGRVLQRRASARIFRGDATAWVAGQTFDAVTVSEALKAADKLDYVGGLAYIGRLQNAVPSSANAHPLCDEGVRERAKLRGRAAVGGKCRSLFKTDIGADEAIAEAQARIAELAERGTTTGFPVRRCAGGGPPTGQPTRRAMPFRA